jgi:hypothetical protein
VAATDLVNFALGMRWILADPQIARPLTNFKLAQQSHLEQGNNGFGGEFTLFLRFFDIVTCGEHRIQKLIYDKLIRYIACPATNFP